jgi:GAF domain-containing protein
MVLTASRFRSHDTSRRAVAGPSEQTSDLLALTGVIRALGSARTVEAAASAALAAVREGFGWAYGSYWTITPGENVLRFAVESGTVNPEFAEVTRSASFAEGVGLSGRAWKTGDLVFVEDLADLPDCVRGPVARRAGVRSGVCFPIRRRGETVATMDFFTTDVLELSAERTEVLRTVGLLVSDTLERLVETDDARRAREDAAAVNRVLAEVGKAENEEGVLRAALDVVREAFGWDYGSVWEIDHGLNALTFSVDSGTVSPEFREVTMAAKFQRGVGLSGRAWRDGQLLFAPNLAEVTDCVRAPAAGRAGVKAGVVLPITINGETIATMDFFATRYLILADSRRGALTSVADLVGQALGRLRSRARQDEEVADQLIGSVSQIAESAAQATTFANDVADSTRDVVDRVALLEESSTEIGKIVAVINAIAEQTNLLALNATIEAARAGEAGRGFAVVAGEVKELAAQTGTATRDVGGKVEAIQAGTRAVSEAIALINDGTQRLGEMQTSLAATLEEQTAIARSFGERNSR